MISPLYIRAGLELVTLVTKAVALYNRGEMTDEEFRTRFIDPMRSRVRAASSRWRNDPLRPEPPELRDQEDRFEQALALIDGPNLSDPQAGSGVPGDGV